MKLSFKFVFGQFIGTLHLEEGEHLFNFELQTQLELPSSFYSKYGHIEYSAGVVLVIPWGFDIKFEQPITINKTVDLNQYPLLRVILLVFNSVIISHEFLFLANSLRAGASL